VVAPAGAAASLYLMCSLPADTWIRLVVWMGLGLIIYFFYGRANAARVRAEKKESAIR
jgi:APA family basic amino acid/polyamine antiporter